MSTRHHWYDIAKSRLAGLFIGLVTIVPVLVSSSPSYGGDRRYLASRWRQRAFNRNSCVRPQNNNIYPVARRSNQVDDYHGTLIADPYRWLESPDTDETKAWVAAQNKLTQEVIGAISQRQVIKNYLQEIWDYEKRGMPRQRGNRTFFYNNTGLQNQDILYVIDSPGAEPRVLIDPNTFSEDGTVSLSQTATTDDGNFTAYSVSISGSDWEEWKVRNVSTGKDLPDHLKWIKFSGVSWTKDNKGFYYSCFDEPAEEVKPDQVLYYQKLYYHRLGTSQAEDTLVYERPDQKEWAFSGSVTDDGRYLLIYIWAGSEKTNRIFYKDLSVENSEVIELFNKNDAQYSLVDNDGTVFWFNTNLNAPRGRVIAVDIAKSTPDAPAITELIAESEATLEDISAIGNRFIVSYLKDAHGQVKEFSLDGKFVREVLLPGLGSVSGFSGKRNDTETYYWFSSYTVPYAIYHYDIASGQSTVHFQPKVDFDPSQFVSRQVFFTSKDGTRVPMFLNYRKGLKLDGTNPTYLYGYGGFNYSITPSFSADMLAWMKMGGVYVEVCLRGGGEYGEEWHAAGKKSNKQNVFDDFIAAAEWLIANKYTCSEKLAIAGASNGGLLVGACLAQRPDLFGAACPDVGVMDMLRYHKFTIGWAWASEYGSSDDPKDFQTLYAYSPLHNIKQGTKYPATYVTTADHDDRVVPGHSYKFVAALQWAQRGQGLCIIRIETKAGHGAGTPMDKYIDASADKWAFLVKALKIPCYKVNQLKK
jgi:prolyl oligopeptidase